MFKSMLHIRMLYILNTNASLYFVGCMGNLKEPWSHELQQCHFVQQCVTDTVQCHAGLQIKMAIVMGWMGMTLKAVNNQRRSQILSLEIYTNLQIFTQKLNSVPKLNALHEAYKTT